MSQDPLIFDPDAIEDVRLEDLAAREPLEEVCRSFLDLCGMALRVFNLVGERYAGVYDDTEICLILGAPPHGHPQCRTAMARIRAGPGAEEQVVPHPCFPQAAYRILPLVYDGVPLGRAVLGPYTSSDTGRSEAIRSTQPNPRDEIQQRVPRIREGGVGRIVRHLRAVLDVLFFCGHRQYLTTQMSIASARDSHQQIDEKSQALREAYEQLKELDRLKSNFLQTVSHELRTPLTSIIGYSEMLSEGLAGQLDAEQREYVTTIRQKGEHLLGLISSILDLAKIDAQAVRLERKAADVPALCLAVLTGATAAAQKKKIRFQTEIARALPEVAVDPEKIRTVVQNLLDNAIKFTPEGGTIRLRVAPQLEDLPDDTVGLALIAPVRQQVEIAITDSGIGIAPEELERIWEPFYQVDSSSTRAYGGTGLGLTIARRLVQAHGGQLVAESEPGRGSTFRVLLPAGELEP